MDGKKLTEGQEASKGKESIKGFTFQAKEFGYCTTAPLQRLFHTNPWAELHYIPTNFHNSAMN